MRWIRRVLVVVVLLLVLIFGLLFSLQNAQSVPLDLLVLQLQARPIAVWLLATFAFGGVAGGPGRQFLKPRKEALYFCAFDFVADDARWKRASAGAYDGIPQCIHQRQASVFDVFQGA